MVYKFKFASHRFAFDTGSGTLHPLDELGYKMLDYLVLPMAPDCPSALRYDLAKYDSQAIDEVYDQLLTLWRDGKLFSPDEEFEATEPPSYAAGAAISETPDGLVVSASETPDPDLEAAVKSLDRRIKDALKNGSGSIFAPVSAAPFEHRFPCCGTCFARKLCTLDIPGAQLCPLERKRIENTLAAGV